MTCGTPQPALLHDSRFLHDRHRRVESQLRALLCGHLRWDSAKRLRAHAVRIPDLLERLEEADQIDAALSRHEALVVTHVLGWRRLRVGNVDVTVLAETPKIGPKADGMRQAIAEALQIEPGQVGIKATTNEGLGSIGRGEGIAVHAVALLYR